MRRRRATGRAPLLPGRFLGLLGRARLACSTRASWPPAKPPVCAARESSFSPMMCTFWRCFWGERLRPALERAASLTNTPAGVLLRSYWGAHQRFFKQLCVSCKVGRLVALVRDALAQGMCAVVGLQSTGEAALERALSGCDGRLAEPVSLCRSQLALYIETHFPVAMVTEAKLKKDAERAERQHEAAKLEI